MNYHNLVALSKVYYQSKKSPKSHKNHVHHKLQKMIQYTWNNNYFYRNYWHDHGITERNIKEVTLNDLPYVDKPLLMENFDIVVTDKNIRKAELSCWINDNKNYDELYHNKYHIVHTSGTSGEQGIFLWDRNSWSYAWAYSIIQAIKPKVTFRKTRAAVLLATEGRYCGAGFTRSGKNHLFDVRLIPVSETLENIALKLEKFQPHQLGGYALMIGDLARLQLAGKLNIKPERIVTSGEPLFKNDIDAIEQAWGVKPINLYMASEGLLIGAQQGYGPFKIFDDLNILTNYHNSNESNICITNLSNQIFPIINYKMGDSGILIPPQKNEKYPTLDLSGYRLNQAVEIINNLGQIDVIHPSLLEEFYVPEMVSFQFKVKNNEVKIYYTSESDISNNVLNNFYDILKTKQADQSVNVKAKRVEKLHRDASGEKFQLIEVVK